MVRLLKWTGALGLLLLGSTVLLRGPLFRALFHFDALEERHTASQSPAPSSDPIHPTASDVNTVDACIDAALDETAAALDFTTGPAASDAAGALRSGKANCIGYAAVFQRNCEARLAQAGLYGGWRVLHLRGLLYCGDFNMHRLFSSPFWKDHDICAVENRASGERLHVDPTLFEALRIRRVCGPAN